MVGIDQATDPSGGRQDLRGRIWCQRWRKPSYLCPEQGPPDLVPLGVLQRAAVHVQTIITACTRLVTRCIACCLFPPNQPVKVAQSNTFWQIWGINQRKNLVTVCLQLIVNRMLWQSSLPCLRLLWDLEGMSAHRAHAGQTSGSSPHPRQCLPITAREGMQVDVVSPQIALWLRPLLLCMIQNVCSQIPTLHMCFQGHFHQPFGG